MRVKLYGRYNTVRESPDSNMFIFEEDYLMVRSDGYLVVMENSIGKTNGASLPPWTWLFMGHPLSAKNERWSGHHDGGFNGTAQVFDIKHLTADLIAPEEICKHWRILLKGKHEVAEWPHQKWWDKGMLEAMRAVGCWRIKRAAAYRVLRLVGGVAWHNNHDMREANRAIVAG